jgi:hydrogenase maturation protease
VLASLAALGGRMPARTLVVGCQVADTADGMGLTPSVEAAIGVAVHTVRALVEEQLAEVA